MYIFIFIRAYSVETFKPLWSVLTGVFKWKHSVTAASGNLLLSVSNLLLAVKGQDWAAKVVLAHEMIVAFTIIIASFVHGSLLIRLDV